MTASDQKKIILVGVAIGAVLVSAAGILLAKRRGGAAGGHPHSHSHGGSDSHSHTHGSGAPAIRPVSDLPKRGYTKEELAEFDGVKNPRILVSLKRKVYEVAPQFYGPGAPYHVFAGKEASRALAKSVLDEKETNKYWVDCSEEELESLEDYVKTFDSKYPVVGWFRPDKLFYEV